MPAEHAERRERQHAARIALVTARTVRPEETDDRHLARALAELGASVTWCCWDDPRVRWKDFDIVVLRSCWDYHLRPDAFLTWIRICVASGVTLVNHAVSVLATIHKRYLLELAAAGVPVPALELVTRGRRASLDEVLASRGWREAVVKPAISASAQDTWRVHQGASDSSSARFRDLLSRADVIVQEFVPEVVTHGEQSLVFIDGEFSHAVRKQPAHGDFRTQSQFGAAVSACDPRPDVLAVARHALVVAGTASVYARVDVIDAAAGPLLMELELIEPQLFLGTAPMAATRFATALIERSKASVSAGSPRKATVSAFSRRDDHPLTGP